MIVQNSEDNIEQKWQTIWEQKGAFICDEHSSKPKYYVLEMLPYPSGKIHVGHVRNYTIGDVLARFLKAKGYNVLHPMGWDAFGLPAENAAISNNTHPATWTYANIKTMREQLKSMGFSYDWNREIASCHPEYYKHEQKFFLDLYKKGLAYQKESVVNWDPIDNTVLANEQVVDGRGWRSGALVEKKYLKQWFLKITNYAEELLTSITDLKGWPQNVRVMQEKWIGKSRGANLKFQIENSNQVIEIYTTKPETIFGASFVALAYNHPVVQSSVKINSDIKSFIDKCSKASTSEADLERANKEGIETGLYATHPLDQNIKLPVIIANFVLMEYGTGALFGCPAHDERDYELATNMNLPIKQVIKNTDNDQMPYTLDEGNMINSDFLNNLNVADARETTIKKIEELKIGIAKTNYRLKDWGISRQRFWGCPIPIIYCTSCGIVPVPEADLPVVLPEKIDLKVQGNPLKAHPTWKQVDCPSCKGKAERETDTFDTFFESSWYFTRYCDNMALEMTGKKACDYWLPVDQYIGGVEHAVMHLLYARFFTKVMNEASLVNIREPFKNLLTQGMVLHATYKDSDGNWLYPEEIEQRDGKLFIKNTDQIALEGKIEKMSKSKKNVVDPETLLKDYGADVIRLFVVSDSPPEKDLEWTTSGIEGCARFINKLCLMAEDIASKKPIEKKDNPKLKSLLNLTVKDVSEDIAEFKLNKAIARIREIHNKVSEESKQPNFDADVVLEGFKIIIRLLNPFIPHITEELWQKLGNSNYLYEEAWPNFDEKAIIANSYVMAIQINGKLRATYEFSNDDDEEMIKKTVIEMSNVKNHLEDKTIKKMIIVPKKIVNIVL